MSEISANPLYPLGRIAKALATAATSNDPATRTRATAKVTNWEAVLQGMADGVLAPGSRTPVANTPPWATLHVITGGFATGNLLAEGPLLPHERTHLASLPPVPDANARNLLNLSHLTEDGLSALYNRVQTGAYEITVPEEGALPVIAWLAHNGHAAAARVVLDAILPWFPRLRFYPVPRQSAPPVDNYVHLQTAAETAAALAAVPPNLQILAQKEAVAVWTPHYDAIIQLFLETLEGPPPALSAPAMPKNQLQKQSVTGGWPCQHYPSDWPARARTRLQQIDHDRTTSTACRGWHHPNTTFSQLQAFLKRAADDPATLSGFDVGKIRRMLAGYLAAHSHPGSDTHRHHRAAQAAQTRNPTYHAIAALLRDRLAAHTPDTGIEDVDALLQPVSATESAQCNLPTGSPIPQPLQQKLQRCHSAPLETLVQERVITSGDVLAKILPQVTSAVRAAPISDPALGRLYAALYRAFRRRRTLMLFDMQSQVKFEELPWVSALTPLRAQTSATQAASAQALREISALAISAFPCAILPNTLVKELRALAKDAGIDLPLVDELATDIFMGDFSPNFICAAHAAATLLAGSVYETYYAIDYNSVRALPVPREKKMRHLRQGANPFLELCSTRAGAAPQRRSPASNGTIIEQQQILTTQNLAALVLLLDLRRLLQGKFHLLARSCFTWICRRQQQKSPSWHASLIVLKKNAYAWRQMIFFLSLLPPPYVAEFIAWADQHLLNQPADFRSRFAPAMEGLKMAIAGHPLPDPQDNSPARQFLGWTITRHWLLPPKPSTPPSPS